MLLGRALRVRSEGQEQGEGQDACADHAVRLGRDRAKIVQSHAGHGRCCKRSRVHASVGAAKSGFTVGHTSLKTSLVR